jgi:iron complex outermembrane recepter protein
LKSLVLPILVLLPSLLLVQPQLRGQEGATVAGTVLDQAGKPIQAAVVTVKNEATTAPRAVTTDSDGRFSVTGLPAGAYTVEVNSPGFARFSRTGIQLSASRAEDMPITLSVEALSQSVTVEETVSVAAQIAPSGNTLEATSAKSEISGNFIRNFETPVADFGEAVNYSPGTFTLSPNGAGLGQGKIFFRGLGDGLYNIDFDGIPFTDTNSVSHHTWANFPTEMIGSIDFDRSPGDATTVGQSTFGGSINLKSVELQSSPDIRATYGYGSWDTRLMRLDYDSGLFGAGNRNDLSADVHQIESNGYQTFNHQMSDSGSLKYQYRISPKSTITLFTGVVDIWNNTPTNTSPTRAQVAQYGNDFLLSGDPGTPTAPNAYYYGFNTYHVQTDFEYIGFNSDLGGGWKFDNKAYTYRYWNSEVYPGTTISLSSAAPSGTDKLNGYRQAGDTAALTHEDRWGIFSVGFWYNWAYTDRYQIPRNPLTGQDTPLGNFHEHFITQSTQPFVQYTFKATQKLAITLGLKDSDQSLVLNQYQDNGGTVGCLGGTAAKDPGTGAPICVGGAAFVTHGINWNNWLPTGSIRYQMVRNWSLYGQFAEGSEAPPTSIFDVTGGNVTTPAKATLAKTYQVGSVLKFRRWTLDADAYYLHYQNGYASYTDITTGDPVNTLTGPSNSKGLEAESNIVIGHGFSLYLNGTMGSDKYETGPNYPNGGLWVADAPKNTETAGLFYGHKNWDMGILHKRVGTMYNDNKTLNYVINGISLPFPVDQAVTIQPFDQTNLFLNYTFKSEGWFRGSKISFSANNLLNNENIVGVSPSTKPTLAVPFVASAGDLINTMAGRSVMVSFTVGIAPKR